MGNTGLESTVPGATSGGGGEGISVGARLKPGTHTVSIRPEADARQGRA